MSVCFVVHSSTSVGFEAVRAEELQEIHEIRSAQKKLGEVKLDAIPVLGQIRQDHSFG